MKDTSGGKRSNLYNILSEDNSAIANEEVSAAGSARDIVLGSSVEGGVEGSYAGNVGEALKKKKL